VRIEDKFVLVTGANRGIGRALVEETLSRGLDRRRYLRRLVTSKISGVTCSSGWARGWRVPA
jgi:NAD(P)-dependent dehydrogenase (short-subunit alcohol dehydrogenase family)